MNPAPRLIVNADDFGLSPGVNAAVVRAHREGILTSATLLANAPAFAEAAVAARSLPSLGVGLHLNLVRGRPLSPPEEVPTLVDAAGRFVPFRFRLPWPDFLRDAAREYRRQLERVVRTGIRPTHVDFEKHHAWQGELYAVACRAAASFGIRAVRTLAEPVAWSIRTLGWPGAGNAAMAAMLRAGFDATRLPVGNMRPPDRLLGQTHIGGMTEAVWLRLAAYPLPGVSEVMVHPALPDAGGDGGMGQNRFGARREAEFEALVSPRVREALTRNGVALVSFLNAL